MTGASIAAIVMNLLCKPTIWKTGKKQKTAYKLEKQIVKARSFEANAVFSSFFMRHQLFCVIGDFWLQAYCRLLILAVLVLFGHKEL